MIVALGHMLGAQDPAYRPSLARFLRRSVLAALLGRGTDEWVPALDALRALCFYGISRVILEPLGSVIMAVGKPGVMFRTNLTVAALEIALLYPALIYGGLVGAAIVVTIAYTVQYALYYPFLRDEVAVGRRDVFAAVMPSLGGRRLRLLHPVEDAGNVATAGVVARPRHSVE